MFVFGVLVLGGCWRWRGAAAQTFRHLNVSTGEKWFGIKSPMCDLRVISLLCCDSHSAHCCPQQPRGRAIPYSELTISIVRLIVTVTALSHLHSQRLELGLERAEFHRSRV